MLGQGMQMVDELHLCSTCSTRMIPQSALQRPFTCHTTDLLHTTGFDAPYLYLTKTPPAFLLSQARAAAAAAGLLSTHGPTVLGGAQR